PPNIDTPVIIGATAKPAPPAKRPNPPPPRMPPNPRPPPMPKKPPPPPPPRRPPLPPPPPGNPPPRRPGGAPRFTQPFPKLAHPGGTGGPRGVLAALPAPHGTPPCPNVGCALPNWGVNPSLLWGMCGRNPRMNGPG